MPWLQHNHTHIIRSQSKEITSRYYIARVSAHNQSHHVQRLFQLWNLFRINFIIKFFFFLLITFYYCCKVIRKIVSLPFDVNWIFWWTNFFIYEIHSDIQATFHFYSRFKTARDVFLIESTSQSAKRERRKREKC